VSPLFFLHFFMYGILLIAINTNAYGEMAYNMALSIKAYSKIPVCLLTDNNGLSSLPDKNNFDEIINVDLQDVLHEGKMNPFFLKTNIYKYSPFEKTLYLDVDGFCVRDFTGIIESLGDFQIHEVRRYKKEDHARCSMVWTKNAGLTLRDLWQAYNLPDDAVYPEYNSSFIFFRKTEKNAAYFEKVRYNYINKRSAYKDIGTFYPDEMAFNITSAEMCHYSSIPGYRPIYFTWEGEVNDLGYIQKNYYFCGMAGGYQKGKMVRLYEGEMKRMGSLCYKFNQRAKIFFQK